MAKKLITLIISLSMALAIFAPSLGLHAEAGGDALALDVRAEGGLKSFELPCSDIMLSELDVIADGFNRATLSWNIIGGKGEAAQSFSAPPYTPFEGSRSLSLVAEENSVTISRDIQSDGKEHDFGSIKAYAFAIWLPREAYGAEATLSLSAARGSYEKSIMLTGGSWQAAIFDLTASEMSGELESVEITVNGLTPAQQIFIDLVGGTTNENFESSLKYMAPSYTLESGAELDSMTVAARQGSYIEATEPSFCDFGGSLGGIRVRVKNNSAHKTITLGYVTDEAKDFSFEKRIVGELYGYGDVASCLFPMNREKITAFRLYFGGGEGELQLLSITPELCYVQGAGLGSITSCAIGSGGEKVTAHASLDSDTVELYKGSTACLYELSAGEDVSSITPFTTPLCDTELAEAMTFSFQLGDGSRLYNRFAVMIYSAEGEGQGASLIQIGKTFSISNPEILAETDKCFSYSSKKGITPASEALPLGGASVTAVKVELDKLILSEGEEGDTLVLGLCKLNREYLSELDRQMKSYFAAKVGVYFVFTCSRSQSEELNELICHPSASKDGRGYAAFNTESQNGISVLAAASEFLARRYSTSKGVAPVLCGITVGEEVNDARRFYNMGDSDFASFIESYIVAFRTVYLAVRKTCSGIDVCLPLGGVWYSGLNTDLSGSYDARLCLEAVAGALGELDFNISYDTCLYDMGIYSYEENSPELSASQESYYVSAANIEVLTAELMRGQNLYRGTQREIVLLEAEEHGALDQNGMISLSADYIYSYLRVCAKEMSTVKAYIPSHGASYENTLTLVDTQRLEELTQSYFSELVGEERCKELVLAASGAVTRFVEQKQLLSSAPSEVKGRTVLFSFDKSLSGFAPSVGCDSLSFGTSLGDRSGLMSMLLGESEAELRGTECYFEDGYDFSLAPYLYLDVQATSLPPSVEKVGIAIAVFSGNSYSLSRAEISPAEWNTLVCDLRSFEMYQTCDRMAIYLYPLNGEEIGHATLLVDSISVMSSELSSEDILEKLTSGKKGAPKLVTLNTVVVLSALVIISGVALFVRAVRRRRKTTGADADFIPPGFDE